MVPRQEAQDPGPHGGGEPGERMSGLAEGVAELIGRLTHLEGPGVAILARLVAVAVTLLLAFATYGILGQLVDRVLRRAAGAGEPSGPQRRPTLAPPPK